MITYRAEETTDLATGGRIFVNSHPDKVTQYLRRYGVVHLGLGHTSRQSILTGWWCQVLRATEVCIVTNDFSWNKYLDGQSTIDNNDLIIVNVIPAWDYYVNSSSIKKKES